MDKRLLVIEDDDDIRRLVQMNLSDLHYQVDACADGQQGLQAALNHSYHAIVLDINLPHVDGLDICRTLRAQNLYTPILMLTARDSEADRIIGLEMGADDYLVKPFSVRELQARTKALLRRADLFAQTQTSTSINTQTEILRFRDLTLDAQKRSVTLAGRAVELTSREFELLSFMAKQPDRVFSRAQLLDQVWGYQHSGYEHTVNSHINRLRNKLEKDPANPQYVMTVWGVGYKFHAA